MFRATDISRVIKSTRYLHGQYSLVLANVRRYGTHSYDDLLLPFFLELIDSIGAYELLGQLLRAKAPLINVTAFETFFDFVGLNSKIPEYVFRDDSIEYLLMIFQSFSHCQYYRLSRNCS